MKTVKLTIRVSPAEKKQLEENANSRGQKLSEYLREMALSDWSMKIRQIHESLASMEQELLSQASITKKILLSTALTNKILHFLAATIYQIKYLVLKFTNVFLVSFKEKIPADKAVPNQKELDQYAADHLQKMDETTTRSLQ